MSPTGKLPLIVALLSVAACAPMGDRNGPPGGPPAPGGCSASVVEQLQINLHQTADALKLTPRQAVLWDAYQEKIGALMADQMKLPSYRARQTAPQQVAQKVDVVRNRLAAMEEIQETADKLYAALDETQKRTADQMLAATLPALYSGLGNAGNAPLSGDRSGERRGGPGGGPGGMGGPGGGLGGGFGRM